MGELLGWVAGRGRGIHTALRMGVRAARRVRVGATRWVGVLAALRLAAPMWVLSIRIRSVGILTVGTAGRSRHC